MGTSREQLIILCSTPIYLLVIGAELFVSHLRQQKTYNWKDTLHNVYLMLLNGGLDLAFRAVSIGIVLSWFYDKKIVSAPLTPWVYWLTLLLFEDFMYYWLHRVDHSCRIFWATHVTHHSSEFFNLSIGFRSSVLEPLYRFVYFIPIALCGFRPIDIAFMYAITQIWGILVHTEKIGRLGWLEQVFVTPSHHRVHHGSNILYLDRNLGMFLIIWDKIFGTFQNELDPATYEPLKYGLTQQIANRNGFNIVFHEFSSIRADLFKKGLKSADRWKYIFGPPGWSHDGSRQTSQQLRRRHSGAQ